MSIEKKKKKEPLVLSENLVGAVNDQIKTKEVEKQAEPSKENKDGKLDQNDIHEFAKELWATNQTLLPKLFVAKFKEEFEKKYPGQSYTVWKDDKQLTGWVTRQRVNARKN